MKDALLRAVAEPHRLEILNLIQESELSSGEIASHFNVSHAAISQHLKVLSDVGLVTVRRVGTQRLYRAHPEGFEELRSLLLYLATCVTSKKVNNI